MILTVKHSLSIYRRFNKDIWGICYTDIRAININKQVLTTPRVPKPLSLPKRIKWKVKSRYLRLFFILYVNKKLDLQHFFRRYIYRLDVKPRFKKKRRYNERFLSVRITRLYYLTYKDHQFRQLFRKAACLRGNMETNYCRMLEGRALAIVYRTSLWPNIFDLTQYIKEGNMSIENKRVWHPNTLLPIGKFIFFNPNSKRRFYRNLIIRARLRRILFNIPSFMYFSFRFYFCFLLRLPKKTDLVFPIAIDMERLTGYY